MTEENNSIIEGMKKAAMIKEAIASIALDKGQTQTFSEEDRKEPTLSDKIIGFRSGSGVTGIGCPVQDIKKCFKKLKEDLCLLSEIPPCEECLICKTINERAGDKLK